MSRQTAQSFKEIAMVAANVQAFVSLGASSFRRPRRRMPDRSTKVEIIFKSQIEFRQAGTEAEQRTGR